MPPLLNKISILSTRLLPEAATAKSADSHICFDSVSFIETQPIIDTNLTNYLRQLATQPLYIVFTSANAVSAVADSIQNIAPNWKIFCTAGKTKEVITQLFPQSTIIASARNAIALANCITALGVTNSLIFFCGDQSLTDLPDTLSASNIKIKEIIVYKTIQTPVAITKNYHGILFFSPSAAHSFFSVNTIPTNITLFSIGATTTAALQSWSANQIITSEWPSTGNLIDCVTSFYNTASQGVN